MLALAGAVMFGGTTGCGGSSKRGSVFENHFPTRDELAKLESTTRLPGKVLAASPPMVDTWRLGGSLPSQLVTLTHSDESPWHQQLTQVIAGRGNVTLTEDMYCVARVLGSFVMDNGGMPTRLLRDFMVRRCGSTVAGVSTNVLTGSDSASESSIFTAWKDQAQGMMKDSLGLEKGPLAMGVWFGNQDGRQVLMVVSGRRLVSMEPVALVPTGDEVVLTGTLSETFQSVRAVINHGRFGYARCKDDQKVALPRFSLRCPVVREDASEIIELVAFKKGRYLGETVLETVTYPGGAPINVFSRAQLVGAGEADEPGVPSAAPAPGADTATRLTALVNDLRAQAGMGPMALSAAQTAQSRRLAPLYFAAMSREVSEAIGDTIVLGLIAGWEIDGLVRDGGFTAGVAYGSAGGGEEELLEQMASRPFGREALFDESMQHIAIGDVRSGDGLGVLVTTYATFTPTSSKQALAHVLDGLNAARARNGLAPASILGGVSGVLKKVGTMIKRNELSYDDAAQALVDSVDQPGLFCYSWAANSLDELEMPDELVKKKNLAVAAVVTYQKVKGVPWAPYVLLLIYGETR
ncbi:MAG: hypothetical protein IT370_00940 [Deltaproteobacteria bacterium]|nr:hypothetical protein [Deltaproteobacteria bacterium]